jgi:hypothetical protein
LSVPDSQARRDSDGAFDDYAGLSVGSRAGENPVRDYQPYENQQ